jgi:hypothetical protein
LPRADDSGRGQYIHEAADARGDHSGRQQSVRGIMQLRVRLNASREIMQHHAPPWESDR